ncbi:MAG TPA: hypothetical protein VM534_02610 [Thermoanaerobaculia bacterium]|nr:hypothetical protein [Thermoanaerobaculia bacterium]
MTRFVLSLILIVSALPLQAGWTPAGLYGADVRSLIADPVNPDILYLGTSRGEIYRSDDGAQRWSNPRGAVQFPGFVIDNLALDAEGRLWVAGWGLWEGSVIAVSDDGGKEWERRDDGITDQSIRALATAPGDPELLIAGGLTGAWRSRDGGRSWKRISSQPHVESVAIDPRSSETIYIGTWRQAWRSDDDGKSWKHIAEGMVLDTDVFGININPKNPDDVWLSTCGWVYHSVDRGDTWVRRRDGFENRRIHVVERDPTDPQRLYAGSVAGLYRTIDAGKTWHRVSDDRLVINSIVVHPERPERMILGTEGDGVYVSYDRGETFARSSAGLHNVKITAVVADVAVRGRVYAAVQFGNAASGIYGSNDYGRTWERLSRTILPEILTLVMHDSDDRTLLAGTESGFFWSADGVEWKRSEPSLLPIRVQRIVPYNRQRLFAGTAEGVFTSRDAGRTWYRLSPFNDRMLDIEVGRYENRPALFALRPTGLVVFDGTEWLAVEGAPEGHRLLFRGEGSRATLFIESSRRLAAGSVGSAMSWKKLTAEAPSDAVVHAPSASSQLYFFRSNGQRHLLLAELGSEFRATGLPLEAREVSAMAVDPFDPKRLYLATDGSGIFIYDDRPVQPSPQGLAAGTK